MSEATEQKQEQPKKLRCGDTDNFAHLLVAATNQALEASGLHLDGAIWNELHKNLSETFNKLFEVCGVEQPAIGPARAKLQEYGRQQFEESRKQFLESLKLAKASSPSRSVN